MARIKNTQARALDSHKTWKKNVMKANPDLAYVISTHLFIEGLLNEWLESILPKPEKILADYRPSFQQLVALCQAHNLLDDDIALIIKKLNALRNKFSHNLLYRPESGVIEDFLISLRKMKRPFYVARVEPTPKELYLALAAVCGYIQKLQNDYKETHSDKRAKSTSE
jgi:hypothetical protein